LTKFLSIIDFKKGNFKHLKNIDHSTELEKKKKQLAELEAEQERQKTLRKQEEDKESEEKRLQELKKQQKIEEIRLKEKKLLDERSQPLRQYLADLVVPTLTNGLIDICKVRPEDPVGYLVIFEI